MWPETFRIEYLGKNSAHDGLLSKAARGKNGCVFCPELNFSSETNLLNHISIVHGGEGPMSGPMSGSMSGPSCIGPMNVPG